MYNHLHLDCIPFLPAIILRKRKTGLHFPFPLNVSFSFWTNLFIQCLIRIWTLFSLTIEWQKQVCAFLYYSNKSLMICICPWIWYHLPGKCITAPAVPPKSAIFLQILSIMWVYINLFYSSGALIWAHTQPSSSICSRDMSKTMALLAPKTPKRPPPSQPIPTDFSQDVLNKRFSGDLFLFYKGIEGQELFE